MLNASMHLKFPVWPQAVLADECFTSFRGAARELDHGDFRSRQGRVFELR